MTGKAHQIIQFLKRIGSTSLLERLALATGLPIKQLQPNTPDDPAVLAKIDLALNILLNSKERGQLEAFLRDTPSEELDTTLDAPDAPLEHLSPEEGDDDEYMPTMRISVDDLIGEEDEPTLLRLDALPEDEVFGEFEDEPTLARWKTSSSKEIEVPPIQPSAEEKDYDSK